MRNVLIIVLLAMPAAAAAAPAVSVTPSKITATGITPGAQVIFFGAGFEPRIYYAVVHRCRTRAQGASPVERMRINSSRNVGIGVLNPVANPDVQGDINVPGNINAKYQDLAEWVPATESMAPGTVVVVDADERNAVTPSSTAYDTSVAGVVSTRPGVLLGEASPSKAKIATTGRVTVRVDASRGAIRAGDLLVTSDRPGVAMRSEAIDVGRVRIHRPGTLIGKAVEQHHTMSSAMKSRQSSSLSRHRERFRARGRPRQDALHALANRFS